MGKQFITLISTFSALLSACATTPQIALDPSKQEDLLVYPLNDARENKSVDLGNCDGSNNIKFPVSDSYMAKNFNAKVHYSANTGVQPNISYYNLANANVERLKGLNRKNEKYILIFSLHQLEYINANTMFTTSLEGLLVNVETGKVVWKNSVQDSRWLGLVGGQMDRLFGTTVAVSACANYGINLEQLLRTFPQLSKGVAP